MIGTCSRCDKQEVELAKHGAGKYRSWCRSCENRRVSESSQKRHQKLYGVDQAYTEKIKQRWVEQSQRRWRKLSPEQREAHNARKRAWWAKAKAAGKNLYRPRIKRELMVSLVLSQAGLCALCKAALGDFHVDHIVPLSAGGSSDLSNLQLLCAQCNMRKGSKVENHEPTSTPVSVDSQL